MDAGGACSVRLHSGLEVIRAGSSPFMPRSLQRSQPEDLFLW
jgi:hypothetical protein